MIEIRRVPRDWRHPRDAGGKYIPLFGTPFDKAMREWKANRSVYPDEPKPVRGAGARPERGSHVPFTLKQATHFQVYEDVSEGTPLSPVFRTKKDILEWCLLVGHRREDAEAFVKLGSVPSLTKIGRKYVEGIHGAAYIANHNATRG